MTRAYVRREMVGPDAAGPRRAYQRVYACDGRLLASCRLARTAAELAAAVGTSTGGAASAIVDRFLLQPGIIAREAGR